MKFSGIRVKTLRLFLLQNNSVTFCSYLPFLPRPSLSPQPPLCARCWPSCPGSLYVIARSDHNAPLQTQDGAGRERIATRNKAKLAVFVSCSLHLSPILCVPLWSAVRKHVIIKHCIGGDTPASVCTSLHCVSQCLYMWGKDCKSVVKGRDIMIMQRLQIMYWDISSVL